MKKEILMLGAGIILGMVLLPFSYIYAQEEVETETDVPTRTGGVQKKIESLVKQLGADEAKVREKATQELKQMGRPALPALKEALKNEDPEVAWRARIIIRAIERTEESTKPRDDIEKVWPKIQKFSRQFRVIIQSNKPYQSFSVMHDPSGKVTVTTQEKTAAGKEETKTYSAESVEEFHKKYPDVAKQYGIGESEVIEIPEIEIEDIWEKLGDSWGRRFEELRKAIEEMTKKSRKLFDENEDEFDRVLPREWFPETKPFVSREHKGELGIAVEFIEPLLREHFGLTDERGILVKKVKEDSLAEKVGFKRGDIVLEVSSEPIRTIWEFRRLLKEALEKEEVALTISIIRKGKREALKYTK